METGNHISSINQGWGAASNIHSAVLGARCAPAASRASAAIFGVFCLVVGTAEIAMILHKPKWVSKLQTSKHPRPKP